MYIAALPVSFGQHFDDGPLEPRMIVADGEDGEPDFDLIEPGRVSRCIMELNVAMGGEELRHGLSFVRREVVGDDVDLLARGLRGDDICEKGNEFRTGLSCPRPVRGKPPERNERLSRSSG